jgi:dTDP-4-amino-4,6-dideoxygalactose transaminase
VEQTQTRDRNGRALAARLARIPGVYPQCTPAAVARHSYHLFLFRLRAAEFGAPRAAVLQALEAEGIPVSGGYALPLYRQPLFLNRAFGPYLAEERKQLDYGNVSCPNCERICAEEGAWLEQSLFLGSETDMDDVARAFEKVHAGRAALAAEPAAR